MVSSLILTAELTGNIFLPQRGAWRLCWDSSATNPAGMAARYASFTFRKYIPTRKHLFNPASFLAVLAQLFCPRLEATCSFPSQGRSRKELLCQLKIQGFCDVTPCGHGRFEGFKCFYLWNKSARFCMYVLVSQRHRINRYNYGWKTKCPQFFLHILAKKFAFPLEGNEMTSQSLLDYPENRNNMLSRNIC